MNLYLQVRLSDDSQQQAEALAAVRRHALALTDIWIAHVLHDAATGAGDAAAHGPDVLAECKRATRVLRDSVRHDPTTKMLVPVFGDKPVEAWIETVAGEV